MARRLSDGIINAFCDYTKDTEIPTVFSMWAAMSTVSAALGRDCFIDRGPFVIYPNLYAVLVAGSAVCGMGHDGPIPETGLGIGVSGCATV